MRRTTTTTTTTRTMAKKKTGRGGGGAVKEGRGRGDAEEGGLRRCEFREARGVCAKPKRRRYVDSLHQRPERGRAMARLRDRALYA
jgi:hypothetical protein